MKRITIIMATCLVACFIFGGACPTLAQSDKTQTEQKKGPEAGRKEKPKDDKKDEKKDDKKKDEKKNDSSKPSKATPAKSNKDIMLPRDVEVKNDDTNTSKPQAKRGNTDVKTDAKGKFNRRGPGAGPMGGPGKSRGPEFQSEPEPVVTTSVRSVYNQSQPFVLGKMERRYLFGVAVSYTDSTTIITDIAAIDGIDYNTKDNTPVGFDVYSDSFRNYLAAHGKVGYICTTFICKDQKEAEKKLIKAKEKARKNSTTRLEPAGDFTYKYISTEHISTYGNGNNGMDEDF